MNGKNKQLISDLNYIKQSNTYVLDFPPKKDK